MQDTPDPFPPETPPGELRGLRFLRVLVTVLTAVMIVGMVAMVWLFATRFPDVTAPPAPAAVAFPDTLELPAGATVQAVTSGPGWWAVVTAEGDILLFDGDGALTRQISADELRSPTGAGQDR